MQLVNNYINGYVEKLSLTQQVNEDGVPKTISLDKENFSKIAELVQRGQFNPYQAYLDFRDELKDLKQKEKRDKDKLKSQNQEVEE